jgi:hypothetical protein
MEGIRLNQGVEYEYSIYPPHPISLLKSILFSFILVLVLTGCDNGPDPELCTCPDKVHGDAPCACDADAGLCDCKQKEFVLIPGITLEDNTGGLVTNEQIQRLTNKLLEYITDPVVITAVSRNTKIRIVTGGDYHTINGNTIEFGIGILSIGDMLFEGVVTSTLYDMTNLPEPVTLLGKRFDSARNTVRIARGKSMLPQRMI